MAILLGLTMLVGCSRDHQQQSEQTSSQENTSLNAPESATIADQPNQAPALVCVLLPLSGSERLRGREMRDGIELAQRHGQAGRRAIEWRIEDTGSQPTSAITAAQQCGDDGAALLIGPVATEAIDAVLSATVGSAISMIVPDPQTVDLASYQRSGLVQVSPPLSAAAVEFVRIAALRYGLRTLAILRGPSDAGEALTRGAQAASKQHGVSLIKQAPITATAPGDWQQAAQNAIDAGAQGLFVAGPAASSPELARLLSDHENLHLWLAPWSVAPGLLSQLPDATVSRLHVIQPPSFDEQFLADYRQRFAQQPGRDAALAYSAARWAQSALDLAQTATPKEIAALLRKPGRVPSAFGSSSVLEIHGIPSLERAKHRSVEPARHPKVTR